ncbi:MAG: FAD:protein FMN transferase [Acidimicrobiales bacterium]
MSERSASLTVGHVYHREVDVMGTVVTIDLFGDELDPAKTARCVDTAASTLREADEMFSTWKQQSPLSRLRRGELTIADVPAEVLDVLEACRTARRVSRRWFDPWSMPGGVDPTGLVKGWAAERALTPLRELQLTGALINAAGDVASFGGPAPDEPFRLGVVCPADSKQLACVVASPGAVATSGTYERGTHLVNPFTGVAVPTASATVTGPELGLADALATALAVAGPAGLEFVKPLRGYEGLVIESSGRVAASDGFPIIESFFHRGQS